MSAREEFDYQLTVEIPHLRRYARALCGNASEADDLVQDCLERAMAKWRLWRGGGSFRGWLMRMLYRQFLNHRRDRRHERDSLSLDALVTPPAVAAAQLSVVAARDLLAALGQLPDAQRDALLLLALEDLSYEEAAWVLDIPVGTLRSRVSRGREALRTQLGREVLDESSAPALRRVK